MGGRVLAVLAGSPNLVAHSALEAGGHAKQLPDGLLVSEDPEVALADVDVVIDFSAPPACTQVLPVCAAKGIACIIASTGLTDEHERVIEEAATRCAVIVAANCSVGVNVLLELVELASKRLAGFEPEIFEIHHKFKRDAPSGTALALGDAVAHRGHVQDVRREGAFCGPPRRRSTASAPRRRDGASDHSSEAPQHCFCLEGFACVCG